MNPDADLQPPLAPPLPQFQAPHRGGRRKKAPEHIEKEQDLVNIGYFNRPVLVNELWDELDPAKQHKIVQVYAKGNYCYALEVVEKHNQLYSWGMGDSYVLGNREEEN